MALYGNSRRQETMLPFQKARSPSFWQIKTKLCKKPRLQWNVPIWLKIFTTSRGDVAVLLKTPANPTHSKLWERVRRSSFLTVAMLHKKNDFVLQPLKEKEEPQEMNTLTGLFIIQPPSSSVTCRSAAWQSHWWIFWWRRGVVNACKINP